MPVALMPDITVISLISRGCLILMKAGET